MGAESTDPYQGKLGLARVYMALTRQQGKRQAQSSPGPKPDCDNCAKALKLCELPPPGRARVCQLCKASMLKCTVGGIPQSTKQAKLAPLDEVGPSKGPLFIESEPGEESASETLETSPAGLVELEGAIRVQTTALQDQLATQEWLAGRLEQVAVVLDGHRTVMEELLAALASVGWRFGAGLGLGLDAQSEVLLRGEWGGIRVMREEVSENEQ